MKDLIIIGAGGVGRETALIVEQINSKEKQWNLLGFIDDNKEIWNTEINGYKVLGGLEYLLDMNKNIYVVVAIANYKVKKSFIEKLNDKFEFSTLIHPNVELNKTIQIGNGTIIYPGVILTTNIQIGNHVIISPKCGIGHDSIIKDYVSLLWNVNISGFDIINEGVLIGSGATILQNLKVGKASIIGASAIVIKSIENDKIIVGNPGREIRKF